MVSGTGRHRPAPTMRDARAKGAARAGLSLQQLYFQLSSVSADDARLRDQLDRLRAKERRTLQQLEATAGAMVRLQQEIQSRQAQEAASAPAPGKQPVERSFGNSVWDITELRY
ncbi:MAG: hypothetical protein ACOYEV_12800 [Candidatus Nanopelagicales bacterium]